jgi:ATP-dependent helicase HrpB
MQQFEKLPLPIDPYLPQIQKLYQENSTIIVKASPGSGKTTRLPWSLASLGQGKVIVLEPRRLAAKLAALRIAQEQGLKIGGPVGYQFRFERELSAETQLIFYTEGTFLRQLFSHPNLEGVGTVILDEFHERHLETDVALAALRALQKIRKDLKIILMSATLDPKLLEAFKDAKLIEIEAQRFNVAISYLPNQPSLLNEAIELKVKKALLSSPDGNGDVLVFLPGMREMRRTADYLGDHFGTVFLLHSEINRSEQEKALAQSSKRKIILATNIAESSLTIPGIKIVIDSGIQRQGKFSPWTGLKTLVDVPITQSSAIQRAGRAGRTADGYCYRLYSEQDFKNREAFTLPEIERADLTDTYLLSLKFNQLDWYTPPPLERWNKARELAEKLGACQEGKLTSLGEKMLNLPLEARLARVLLAAEGISQKEKQMLLKYITEEIEGDQTGLLNRRIDPLLPAGQRNITWEKALLSGFIDQVARFRPKQQDFIHYSGKTLKRHASLDQLHHDYYLILDVTTRLEAIQVVPIEEEWLYEIEPFPFEEKIEFSLEETFKIHRLTLLGSIPVESETIPLNWEKLPEEIKQKILIAGKTAFLKRLNSFKEKEFYLKSHFYMRSKGINPIDADQNFTILNFFEDYTPENWDSLEVFFENKLKDHLGLVDIDRLLPDRINLGGKRDLKIFYPLNLDPFVEAPIQDFYGTLKTPTILEEKLPLTLKLLGPHKRPIQVTKDIEGFWKRTYLEMLKEWQREYPRHYWPADPATAKPILLKSQLDKS